MLRAAEAIAHGEYLSALVTGDRLRAARSQTLENLVSIEAAVKIPVFRPLAGTEEPEIVREAEAIGISGLSSNPPDDFDRPRGQVTNSWARQLVKAEQSLDVAAEVKALLDSAELLRLGERSYESCSWQPG
jgi:tRNA uracil 4-sulfurtransferase